MKQRPIEEGMKELLLKDIPSCALSH
uniref:Uncharacterized protein n=1 Tax=Solanum lycopersicum TaxID=4081 RepID=K4D934_SOLLC